MIALITSFVLAAFVPEGLPPKIQPILQAALDFQELHDHIDSNTIIISDRVKYMKADKRLARDLHLTFNGRSIHFNDVSTSQLFFDWYSFEFEEIRVKKNKATIVYKFYPEWVHCSSGIQATRSESLYILVRVEFIRNADQWTISEGSLKDLEFTESDPPCIRARYKPIGE